MAKDIDIEAGVSRAIETYITSELIPHIKSSRFSSFLRNDPPLVFGTGAAPSGQPPNIKVPPTSFPTFKPLDILEMKDLLPFLARTNSNSKESYVIHLISEVEIEKPMTESYDSGDKLDQKLKSKNKKGKNARSVSISGPVSEPKRARTRIVSLNLPSYEGQSNILI